MPGRFRRGYVAFLYRWISGFVENDPDRPRKRKPRRRRIRGPRVFKLRPVGKRTRVRTRAVKKKILKLGEWWRLVGSGSNQKWEKSADAALTLTSPYDSVEHCQDYLNPGPPYASGGPFTSVKVNLQPSLVTGLGAYRSPTTLNFGDGSFLREYRGGFGRPDWTSVDFTEAQYADRNFLLGEVAGFVPPMASYHLLVDSKLRPQISVANVGQSLAEIREVPRMLSTTAKNFHDYWRFIGGSRSARSMTPKGAADSFLNAQFGWAPFVNDISDVCDLIVNSDRYISGTTNRNNRWLHRKKVLAEFEESVILSQGTGQKCQPDSWQIDALLAPGSWTKRFQYTKTQKTKVWATGHFKFYRPEFDMTQADYNSGLNQIRRVQTLLGLNMSPSLLWNITPWTWMSDWFLNIGNVIDAVSAAGLDGIVSRNVFLMMSYSREIVLTQELNFMNGPIAFQFARRVQSKQRGHALTPFSFGLLPSQLSGKQLTILGALGLTRFA